jgi:hypothetical protein
VKTLSIETAIEKLRPMKLLRFFPNEPEALLALAELVCKWCVGYKEITPEQQCTDLVKTALSTMYEWQSPENLHDLFRDLFPMIKRSGDGGDPYAIYDPELRGKPDVWEPVSSMPEYQVSR